MLLWHILLILLKILGIILLILLGLILLLLFVPIRYRFSLKTPMTADIGANYLGPLVRFQLSFQDKKLSMSLKVLMFTVFSKGQEEEKAVEQPKNRIQKDEENQEHLKGNISQVSKSEKEKNTESDPSVKDDQPAAVESAEVSRKPASHQDDKSCQTKKTGQKKVKNQRINNKKDQKEAENQKINNKKDQKKAKKKEKRTEKEVREKKESKLDSVKTFFLGLKNLYEEYHVRELLPLLKKQIFRLINHIRPRKMGGYAAYGLTDPATTGQITGLLSMFYPYYREKLTLEPDFVSDRNYLDADLSGKGRIRIFNLLLIVIALLLDKNVRHLLKKIFG
ncbi:MAG: DUF2953 domain-containing protein [Lachnospiraceae bacterium]|nr:DUF2953 domain-containing protein [Lachnospiraceae bacterium]